MKATLTILNIRNRTGEVVALVVNAKRSIPLLMGLSCPAAFLLPALQAQGAVALTTLYSFTGGNDGANPTAKLVEGSDRSFYGTTYSGGARNSGTVFKISTNGALTSLYAFTGGNDGAIPLAGLVQGSDGKLYGTTFRGGTSNSGTVFRIGPDGAFTNLYSFASGNTGDGPNGLIQGRDGYLYGTTQTGGTNTNWPWGGTVFRISANGLLTSLDSFESAPAGLVQVADGNLYVIMSGIDFIDTVAPVFKISLSGAASTLYTFDPGFFPSAALVQGSDGNLYGTTRLGSTMTNSTPGTVFRMTTNGGLTFLHFFGRM